MWLKFKIVRIVLDMRYFRKLREFKNTSDTDQWRQLTVQLEWHFVTIFITILQAGQPGVQEPLSHLYKV